MCDTFSKGGEVDTFRLTKFLNTQNDTNGSTALMIAASHRNGSTCRLLITIGCNTDIRDRAAHTASMIARNAGWKHLGDWLTKKTGAGSLGKNHIIYIYIFVFI